MLGLRSGGGPFYGGVRGIDRLSGNVLHGTEIPPWRAFIAHKEIHEHSVDEKKDGQGADDEPGLPVLPDFSTFHFLLIHIHLANKKWLEAS